MITEDPLHRERRARGLSQSRDAERRIPIKATPRLVPESGLRLVEPGAAAGAIGNALDCDPDSVFARRRRRQADAADREAKS